MSSYDADLKGTRPYGERMALGAKRFGEVLDGFQLKSSEQGLSA